MADLAILVKLKDDASAGLRKLNTELKDLETQTEQTAKATAMLTKVGMGLMAFGGAITGALGLSAKAAASEEVVIVRLTQALKNVNVEYNNVKKSLESIILGLEQKTAVIHDTQYAALAQLVIITNSYDKALKLLPLALDLAAAKEMDVVSAAQLLGRVAMGSNTLLARYGIVLKEDATAAEALAEIQKKVGGTAEAMGNTAQGSLNKIKNSLDSLMESVGYVLLPLLTYLAEKVKYIIDWLDRLPGPIKTTIIVVSVLTAGVTLLSGALIILSIKLPIIITQLGILQTQLGMISTTATIAKFAVLGLGTALAGLGAFAVGWTIGTQLRKVFNMDEWWPSTSERKAKEAKKNIEAVHEQVRTLVGSLSRLKTEIDTAKMENKPLLPNAEDAFKNLLKVIKDLEREVPGSIEAVGDTEWVTKLINELDMAESGFDEFGDTAEDTFEKIQKAAKLADDQIDTLNNSIDTLMGAINKLSEPRLEGMGEWERQLFDIDQKIKEIELKEAKYGETTALEKVKKKWQRLREEVRLTGELKYEPQQRELREMAEEARGENIEVPFTERKSVLQSTIDQLASYIAQKQSELLPIFRDLLQVPGLASGGIVTQPTLAMVGERGPEAVVPLGSMGNVTVNFNNGLFMASEIEAREFARRISSILSEENRRSAGGK